MGLSEYAKVENTQDVKNTLKKYADELMNYKTGQFTYLDGFSQYTKIIFYGTVGETTTQKHS